MGYCSLRRSGISFKKIVESRMTLRSLLDWLRSIPDRLSIESLGKTVARTSSRCSRRASVSQARLKQLAWPVTISVRDNEWNSNVE